MTDRVNPSEFREASAFKTAGAIALSGGEENGYITGASSPSEISTQDADIDETQFNAFAETSSGTSFDVTIDPGEAFVYGAWCAIDTSTTVTLASSTAGQTVYVGWNKDGTNDVIIGLQSAFDNATGNTDQKIPLFDFDTDGSGVTSVTDRRLIGKPITTDEDGNVSISEDLSLADDKRALYGSDDDFSVQYNSTSDELELVDEINSTIKQTWDKSGDTHIPNGALNMRNSNSIQDSGTNAINFDGSQNISIPSGFSVSGNNVTSDGIHLRYIDPAGRVQARSGGTNSNLEFAGSLYDFSANAANIRVGTGQSIEDGAGNNRIDIADPVSIANTSLQIPSGDLQSNFSVKVGLNYANPYFRWQENGTPKMHLRWDSTGSKLDLTDNESTDDRLSFPQSSGVAIKAQTNANIDLNGNSIIDSTGGPVNVNADQVDGNDAADLQGGEPISYSEDANSPFSVSSGEINATLASSYDIFYLFFDQVYADERLRMQMNGNTGSNYNTLFNQTAESGQSQFVLVRDNGDSTNNQYAHGSLRGFFEPQNNGMIGVRFQAAVHNPRFEDNSIMPIAGQLYETSSLSSIRIFDSSGAGVQGGTLRVWGGTLQ